MNFLKFRIKTLNCNINKKTFIFSIFINFLLIAIFSILLNSCESKVSLQTIRQPSQRIEQINYIELGEFKVVGGKITMPINFESTDDLSLVEKKKLLKPNIINFISKKLDSEQISDLVKAAIVHELSIQSKYKLIYDTGKQSEFSGVIPDENKTAVLNGKIKFFELKIESKEDLSYFTNVKNKGVSFEQSILASTIAIGAEASGVGFQIATPYVEHIAAIEVEFSLLKKSDRSEIIKNQYIRSFYTDKWRGDPQTSHLPKKLKSFIISENEKDENISKSIVSRIDKSGLKFLDPTEYFTRGFNLRKNERLPKTLLNVKIRLGRMVAKKIVQKISPYSEVIELKLMNGNKIGSTLIRAHAYQEAISFLLELDNRDAEDEYNLGLAYEAVGKTNQASIFYQNALKKDPNKLLYKNAFKRTRIQLDGF